MSINTKFSHIKTHTQLMYTIMQVNAAKAQQEDDIKHKLKELYYSFQPATIIKNAVGNILHSPETKKNVAQTAMALGTEFLISKFFKRGASIKGFFSSLIVEKIADYALRKNPDLITNGINKISNLLNHLKK